MSPALIRLCALLSLALSTCATATPPTNVNPTSQKTTMNTSNSGTTAPKVQQLSKGLLALIGSLQSNNDLTPERIEQTAGLTMLTYPEAPNRYEVSQKLTNDWLYVLTSFTRFGAKSPSLTFAFWPITRPAINDRPALTDVCIDLEQFHQALLGMGYQMVGGVRNFPPPSNLYRRGNVEIDIAFEGESNENVTHDCITLITI